MTLKEFTRSLTVEDLKEQKDRLSNILRMYRAFPNHGLFDPSMVEKAPQMEQEIKDLQDHIDAC